MRRYETIIILRPTLTEKQIDSVVENSTKIITDDSGAVIELDRWGMRKLAYLIKKEKQGFYVYVDYSALPESVSEMERKFRIDDSVLKYMTVKVADAISDDEISAAKGKAEEKLAAIKAAAEAEKAEQEEKTEEPAKAASKEAETTESKPESKKEEKAETDDSKSE